MSSSPYISTSQASPRRLLATALGSIFVSATAPAFADANTPPDLPDADNARELDSIQVDGYVISEPASSKFTAPLLDTPRSVAILPEALIGDVGATDLVDALRLIPGITFGAGEGGNPQGDRPYLRGFDSQGSIFVDGVRDAGSQTRETFNIQQIEVVKGPDSVYSGRSNGGGSINLVTKAPVAEAFTQIALGLGNAEYRRATLDTNVLIGDNAALRVNVMGQDAGVAGRDAVNGRRFGFAPSVTFGLNSTTSATLGFYHLQTDELPEAGIPYRYSFRSIPAGVRVVRPDDGGDSSNFYGLVNRDFRDANVDIGTLQIRHEFGNGMSLRNTTRYGRSQQDYIVSMPDDSQGNVINGEVWRRVNTRAGNTVSAINQTDLSGEFKLGATRNVFNVGLELANEKAFKDRYIVPYINASTACETLGVGAPSFFNCTSLSNPNPNDPWQSGTYDSATDSFVPAPIVRANDPTRTTADTQALYLLDTMHFSENWLLNLGLRFDRFSTKAPVTYCPDLPGSVCPRGYSGPKVTEEHRSTSNEVTGQIGLVWKPVEAGSVYLSLANSATPPGSFLSEGSDTNPISINDLDPERTKNIELGVKWNLFGDRLAVSADLFNTEKTNARQLDVDGSYQNIGKSRVRGIELSATGNITEAWSVFAGYAYMKGKLVDGGFVGGEPNPINGTPLANIPENSFSLWSSYQLSRRLSFGGGAFYADDVAGSYRVNAADGLLTEFGMPSYWRFDAMANWQATEKLGFQLNLQNLTDKTYYTKAYPVHFVSPAAGRSVLLTANLKF
ncbi:MAG TPA: TonB-dependent siderophore receptor [Dokdonella sp.]|uniref:TonB-dependent receptor n=1 Tax=Dokdonella sp. TaxID=2291710 RepID=UPI002D807451|nr:TonB-dependent siderophore receptor [Dokdonella sp.]HET9032998.1 TonB-dependent siderophore receptor [Dokdonella sp.]